LRRFCLLALFQALNNQKNYLAGVAAFMIWGFFSIPLRALRGFYVGEILFFRILFSAVILIVLVGLFKRNELRENLRKLNVQPSAKRRNMIVLTFVGGGLLIVNWLTFIYIVNTINVKTASFSYMICPVITAVLGSWLLKERMDVRQWIAVGLCAISCLLIGLSSALELGYSFLTAFTYALYLVSQRKNQGFDRLIVLSVQMLFAFVVLLFGYSLLVKQVPSDPEFYLIISIIAGIFTVLPLFLNLFALNKVNSATIGILLYLNPIINFILALVVFNEKVDFLQGLGYAIIVGAIVLFNYTTIKRLLFSKAVTT
jgi:chloramphenicol-sensitive protein RarD